MVNPFPEKSIISPIFGFTRKFHLIRMEEEDFSLALVYLYK